METDVFNLNEIVKKNNLWGEIDGENIFEILNSKLNKNDSKTIEINLGGIKSMDNIFIQKTFIRAIKIINENNFGFNKLIFSNPDNDIILYSLNRSLKKKSLFAIFKNDEYYSISGNIDRSRKQELLRTLNKI